MMLKKSFKSIGAGAGRDPAQLNDARSGVFRAGG